MTGYACSQFILPCLSVFLSSFIFLLSSILAIAVIPFSLHGSFYTSIAPSIHTSTATCKYVPLLFSLCSLLMYFTRSPTTILNHLFGSSEHFYSLIHPCIHLMCSRYKHIVCMSKYTDTLVHYDDDDDSHSLTHKQGGETFYVLLCVCEWVCALCASWSGGSCFSM